MPASNPQLEEALRRLAEPLPGALKHRLLNALDHFERSDRLFDIDREMASFRAITGEEEAATMVMHAIHLRKYPHWKAFNPRDHQHKSAIIACVLAISRTTAPFLREFQLVFNFRKSRIDLKIPMTNFGVVTNESYAVQPDEPLNLTHSREGVAEQNLFDGVLGELADAASFADIKNLIAAQTNSRNLLLYASDSRMPESKATEKDIEQRRKIALTLLVLGFMIFQARSHLPLVRQAMMAFLSVMNKLPPELGRQD